MISLNLKNQLVGKIDLVPYEDIGIVCRKDRKNLTPNIYVNTKFLSIGKTIRGTIIIVRLKDNSFKSLTKEQAIKYIHFLKNASFHFNNINKDNNFFLARDKQFFKSLKKELISDDLEKDTPINNQNRNDEVLQMILAIQTIILKFIKNNKN